MGLSYKVDTLPETLREGEFAVVDGVVYVGNSSNEPVPSKGYLEIVVEFSQVGTNAPTITVIKNDINKDLTPVRLSAGSYELRFDDIISFDGYVFLIKTFGLFTEIASAAIDYSRSGPPYSVIGIRTRDYNGDLSDISSTSPRGGIIRLELTPV